MIILNNVAKQFSGKYLLQDVNLAVNRGEKIGLIGPNGAGKSTLFRIILQKEEISGGTIQVARGTRIGYLPQEKQFHSTHTVMGELMRADGHIVQLCKERDQLEQENRAITHRYSEVISELEHLGYFQLQHKGEKILSGLGFTETDFHRPIVELSGGWQMRVLLAKLLTCTYDLLLLDEPTNYLDLDATLWFKDYLAGFEGTFIMISHDRAFLDEVTNSTLVLEHANLEKMAGNYEHYRSIKQQQREHLLKQSREQEKKRQQLELFVSRFHAQPNKAAQVRAKKRVLEKMETIEIPPDRTESVRNFHFSKTTASGYRVVKLERIDKSYGPIQVYKDFDFEIIRGEKAVLTGPNGAGKSTLLKILAGVVPVDKGNRILGHKVEVGYFSQDRMDILNPQNTVLEEAYSVAPGDMRQEALRTILGTFLFTGDDVEKMVKVLSGGEKSRLNLAKLLINPPNFLLLDEPTTHLDVDAVDALIRALNVYEGTLVCISHDVHFVRSVANTVYDVKAGCVRKYPGKFDYYLEKKKHNESQPQGDRVAYRDGPVVNRKEQKKIERVQKKEKEKKLRVHNAEISKRIKSLRKNKEKLEIELSVKQRILSNPTHDEAVKKEYQKKADKIEHKIAKIDSQIDKLKTQFLDI
ncbi:MAG: ATP-binding cassette domain-containing protein [Candidatus Omnitrophica bacterium]|nr:ATP-binding cassette domain-containing protein [Candidatus Omnitrophota bacterium]